MSSDIVKGVSLPANADRVGNVSQKELALLKAGVTRERVARKIAELLDAENEVIDKWGQSKKIKDLASQRWAVEQASNMFGDTVVKKGEGDVAVQTNITLIVPSERSAEGRFKEVRI